MLTVKEYAKKKGISQQAVYSKIKRNILKSTVVDGIKYVVESIEQQLNNTIEEQNPLKNKDILQQENNLLNKEIKHLQQILNSNSTQIQQLLDDKETLNKRLEEANHISMASQSNLKTLTQTIQQLEYKNQEVEKELEDIKNKKWWQRIFNSKY